MRMLWGSIWGCFAIVNPSPTNGDASRPFTLSSRLITPYNGPQCGLYESFYHALRRIFMTDSKGVFYGSPHSRHPRYWVFKGSPGSLHCFQIIRDSLLLKLAVASADFHLFVCWFYLRLPHFKAGKGFPFVLFPSVDHQITRSPIHLCGDKERGFDIRRQCLVDSPLPLWQTQYLRNKGLTLLDSAVQCLLDTHRGRRRAPSPIMALWRQHWLWNTIFKQLERFPSLTQSHKT